MAVLRPGQVWRRWLWLPAAGAVGALAWAGWQYSTGAGTAAAPQPPPVTAASPDGLQAVTALGRIEPRHGVTRVAGPPRPAIVIGRLEVAEGDRVGKGQVLAVLAEVDLQRAEVARLEAELGNAERELVRKRDLFRAGALSDSEFDAVELRRDVTSAGLARAKADLELSTVRSPIDGLVIAINAREGERVGTEGIAELGEIGIMYAVAEVYETDIGRVRVGQRARVSSPALADAVYGDVERIGLKIGKKDVLSTDPVADVDARVVEVDIRLDEPEPVVGLSNLRVQVEIQPGSDP